MVAAAVFEMRTSRMLRPLHWPSQLSGLPRKPRHASLSAVGPQTAVEQYRRTQYGAEEGPVCVGAYCSRRKALVLPGFAIDLAAALAGTFSRP